INVLNPSAPSIGNLSPASAHCCVSASTLSLRNVAVGYEPKLDLSDERRPLCLGRAQLMRCFFRSAVTRPGGDDTAEHCRKCNGHNRGIELERTDQNSDENRSTANHDDPPGQDKLAAVFNPGGELINLLLKPYDLVAIVTIVHRTIRKSGYRFSEEIMLKQEAKAKRDST